MDYSPEEFLAATAELEDDYPVELGTVREAMRELVAVRNALQRIASYDVEANHGPVDEWAEAEAFAAVTEIADAALKSGAGPAETSPDQGPP